MLRKSRLYRIVTLMLVVVMISAVISGCTGEKAKPKDAGSDESGKTMNVYISIDYPDEANLPDLINQKFVFEKGSTALDSIQLYGTVVGLPILVETTGGDLVGINNIKNGDYGNGHWDLFVNGKPAKEKNVSATPSHITLESEDSVRWVYTVENSDGE